MKSKLFGLLAFLLLFCSSLFAQQPEALKIGESAPMFRALDQNGKPFVLETALRNGPVLVVFYRGEWCGYCNRHMQALQDSLGLLQEKNVTVVAITPETSENVLKTMKKTKASFQIIADANQEIMHAFKTTFTLDDKTQEKYKGYGINLPEVNTANTWTLPVPATYLIDTNGKISFVHFDENYSQRASVKDILKAL